MAMGCLAIIVDEKKFRASRYELMNVRDVIFTDHLVVQDDNISSVEDCLFQYSYHGLTLTFTQVTSSSGSCRLHDTVMTSESITSPASNTLAFLVTVPCE